MYQVYVLYSKDHDKIYIGYTSNLEERIESHNHLATKGWTIKYRPWEMLYTESFEETTRTMNREKQLKTYQGRLVVRRMLKKKPIVGSYKKIKKR